MKRIDRLQNCNDTGKREYVVGMHYLCLSPNCINPDHSFEGDALPPWLRDVLYEVQPGSTWRYRLTRLGLPLTLRMFLPPGPVPPELIAPRRKRVLGTRPSTGHRFPSDSSVTFVDGRAITKAKAAWIRSGGKVSDRIRRFCNEPNCINTKHHRKTS